MKFSLRERPPGRYGGDLIAILAGAASVLAFAPFHAWLLAIVCPALLVALWSGGDARLAAWRGFLYGAAEFLTGIYWIYIAVSGLGPAPWWLGVLLYILLSCACAVFPALTGYAVKRFSPAPGYLWLFLIPALWTLFEWLRSFILTGFPWLALGFSQGAHVLGGYAAVSGVYGVSFACVLAAVLLVLVLRASVSLGSRLAAAAAIAVVFITGAALGRIAWTQPTGASFTVALAQANIPQQEKWTAPAVKISLQRYSRLTRSHPAARLVVWPEAAIPSWYMEVAPQLQKLGAEERAHDQSVVYGVLAYDWQTGNGYNAVAAMGAGVGLKHNIYFKRHLVPFGEYFPVPGWIKRWLSKHALPHSSFTPGPLNQPPLAVRGWRIAVANCYEIAFGRLLRRQLPLANFIINVSDDGWFGHSIASAQQFEMAQTAARETGRYVLASANSGITGIIGPQGSVISRLPRYREDALTGKIRSYNGTTPFVRLGNWLIVCLSLAILVMGVLLRWLSAKGH